jgi:3-deoxy-D-manno-octulosonic-acid transferase
MRFFYSLGIRAYGLGILIWSIFNPKARQWVKGRKNWKSYLKKADIKGAIWIHCSSLGEFEQGRPVLEGIKKQDPGKKILLTFFSPSGYEIRKNYPFADYVCYLPLDTPANARQFVEIAKPEIALFVKYEIWHNLYRELAQSGIAHYIISAIFRKDQIYFKPYGAWFRKTLKATSGIFTQDEQSLALLKKYEIKKAEQAGDTRFDRVFEISQNAEKIGRAERFASGKLTLVAGSTWPADEKCLFEALKGFNDIKLIIAPHLVDEKHIDSIRKLFPKSRLWSETEVEDADSNTLIVDKIGLLSSLYASGNIAYIGGGFGAGIHNTLEPACFGLPVIFGPKYSKFKEAVDLITQGGGFSVSDSKSLRTKLQELISNEDFRKKSAIISREYVERSRGATTKILNEIID